jgi:tetratricopeptide (TPR) repeat protein
MKPPRSIAPARSATEPVIRWQGKPLTIAAACALAVDEHRRGNLQAVVDIYALILKVVPGFAEGHNNRAVVLQQMNRLAEALAGYDRAIALKPGYANAHFNRGTVLKKMSRRDEALASYDQAIALKPDHVEAFNNRGAVLQELKRYDEALASYDRAIALNPAHAEAVNNRGIVLASKGRMAEAEAMFRQASTLKPDLPDPLFNLANIRDHHDPNDPEVENIRALVARPGLSAENQEHLHFSLGKIYDDCGRYDEAFAQFQQANQLRNTQVAYDAGLVEQMTNAIIGVFSSDFLARPSAFASQTRSPIFIVGMPRSGTTLLASILSNHPAIASAGELPTLGDLTASLSAWTGGVPYPAAARHLTAAAGEHVIGSYETRLRRDIDAAIPHVVDKSPLNFRHLGLIAMLFPQARIIHCTRHPLATCLSNYFQRFPLHLDYSFDLRNIGNFYREYARFMEHWHKIPSLQLLDVSYEELIMNTAPTTRRLLDFLGLPWDERCLAPHTNTYAVETASQWQVRQPIYQRSLDHWRHYEKHLGPVKESLATPAVTTLDVHV